MKLIDTDVLKSMFRGGSQEHGQERVAGSDRDKDCSLWNWEDSVYRKKVIERTPMALEVHLGAANL